MKTTTCEEDVVVVIVGYQMPMETLHLFLHESEINIIASVLEILAVEVHHKMPNDCSIVFDPMVFGRLGATIAICSVIGVAGAILPLPIRLQCGPISDNVAAPMLTV